MSVHSRNVTYYGISGQIRAVSGVHTLTLGAQATLSVSVNSELMQVPISLWWTINFFFAPNLCLAGQPFPFIYISVWCVCKVIIPDEKIRYKTVFVMPCNFSWRKRWRWLSDTRNWLEHWAYYNTHCLTIFLCRVSRELNKYSCWNGKSDIRW